MIYIVLIFFGLSLGSFVNALVWRLHQNQQPSAGGKLSITTGHSICPDCGHQLAWFDLVPILSWLALKGACRYCQKPISWQYPAVELFTAVLFAASYVFWPEVLSGTPAIINFIVWLAALVGLVALLVYDLKWMILPNKIIYPLVGLVLINIILQALLRPEHQLLPVFYGAVVGFGIFYVLFQVSGGKWIGGGDVKLGLLFGLLAADPVKSLFVIFIASVLGTIISIPSMVSGKMDRKARIPFGPFLILATIIVVLFGDSLITVFKELVFVV